MKIIPYEEDGEVVLGQYLVVVPTLFGEAVLFGPASLADCEAYMVRKFKELGNDITQQVKNERKKEALRQTQQQEEPKGRGFDY